MQSVASIALPSVNGKGSVALHNVGETHTPLNISALSNAVRTASKMLRANSKPARAKSVTNTVTVSTATTTERQGSSEVGYVRPVIRLSEDSRTTLAA